MGAFVVARDRAREKVLLGGLGCMGVGQMWFDVTPDRETFDNFDDAPEEDAPEYDSMVDSVLASLKAGQL